MFTASLYYDYICIQLYKIKHHTMNTMFTQLLELPLFQGLCLEDLTQILEKVKLHFVKYKAGETIIASGSDCNQLLFVLKGSISATTSTYNSLTFIELLETPQVIEPQSLFGMQTRYVSTYVAHTPVQAVIISKLLVVNDLFEYEIFRLNYMNMIGNRAQTFYNRLLNKSPCNTEVKIIRFIVARTEWMHGEKWLKVSRSTLAQELGESMLSITQALHRLQENNLLVLTRMGITVPDICQLVEWCKQEENRGKDKKE